MTDLPADARASKALLASNIVYGTFALGAISLCQFVSNWAVIRWFGASFHGNLVWLLAAAQLGLLLSDLGLAGKGGIRGIARLRATRTDQLGRAVSEFVTIPLILAAALGLAMIVAAGPIAAVRGTAEVAPVRMAGAWILLMAGIRACRTLSIGFERIANTLFMTPVAELAKMLWVFACAAVGLPVIWIFIGWTGAFALALLVSLWRTRALGREFGLRFRLRLDPLGKSLRVVREALPYYVPQVGAVGLAFIVQLLIGAWHRTDSSEVSVFQVCFSLAVLSRLLATPISSALLPRIAHIDATPEGDHDQTTTVVLLQITRFLGLIATLVFAVYWAIGSQALALLYGPKYAANLPALLLLAFAVGAENYSLQLDQVLMAMRYVGVVGWLEVLKYAVLGAIGCWAIPAYGALGAAGAIGAATAVNVTGKMIATRTALQHIGAASFLCTVATFAAVAGAGLLPFGAWLVLPAWLIAVLALRLLRPREIVQWCRILHGILSGRERVRRP